ncbi:hypothetical protein Trydic_g5994 [Trypoxylus dichotomus]
MQRILEAMELLTRYRQENRFLESTVTGDETRIHHHNSKSKKDSIMWNRVSSPTLKKFSSLQKKTMVTVLVYAKYFAHRIQLKTTINSDIHCKILEKVQAIRQERLMKDFRLLHDNARPHTSNHTKA